MEHVVFYPSADGSPAFRRVGSLDEAVNFVEHLRNIEGVTDFSVHALTLVPLSFRAYYHVEVPPGETAPTGQPAQVEAVVVGAPVAAEPFPESPVAPVAPVAPVETVVAEAPVAEAPVAEAPVQIFEQPSSPPVEAAAVAEPAPVLETVPVAEPAPVAEAPAAQAVPVEAGPAAEAQPIVDPSVEEVVPVPSGRRSMGFFARS